MKNDYTKFSDAAKVFATDYYQARMLGVKLGTQDLDNFKDLFPKTYLDNTSSALAMVSARHKYSPYFVFMPILDDWPKNYNLWKYSPMLCIVLFEGAMAEYSEAIIFGHHTMYLSPPIGIGVTEVSLTSSQRDLFLGNNYVTDEGIAKSKIILIALGALEDVLQETLLYEMQ